VARQKLRAMVAGVAVVRAELGPAEPQVSPSSQAREGGTT
jgi:hypothetical protein